MKTRIYSLLLTASVLALGSCGSDSATPAPAPTTPTGPTGPTEPTTAVAREFQVRIVNLTAGGMLTPPGQPTPVPVGQVMSPPVAIAHSPGFDAFEVGKAASEDLERLAESGIPTNLLTSLGTASMGDDATVQHFVTPEIDTADPSTSIILPGANRTLTLKATAAFTHLTVLTKLTRTNDGFAAIDAELISDLAEGESRVFHGLAYDAGTEANTETVATLLDAAQMNGFDAERDDTADFVSVHPGVVTSQDIVSTQLNAQSPPAPTSILTNWEKFDNPVMRVEVTRVKPAAE